MGHIYEKIACSSNIYETFNWLRKKNPNAGPDGVTWLDVYEERDRYLERLIDELEKQTYMPNPDVVCNKESYPGSNKNMKYVKMNMREKIVEYAIKRVVYPIYEAHYLPLSCAYRFNLGDGYLLFSNLVEAYKDTGKNYFISLDIKSYYQTIVHNMLCEIIYKYTPDLEYIKLVSKCLNLDGGKGIPVGHVLSTLYSNLFLHDIDLLFKDDTMIRYADNFCFAGNTMVELAQYKEKLVQALSTIHLSINDNKTKCIYKPDSYKDLLV